MAAGELERHRDHYRRMARTALTSTDRDLWTMLADELDGYLALEADLDLPLFGGDVYDDGVPPTLF